MKVMDLVVAQARRKDKEAAAVKDNLMRFVANPSEVESGN